MRNRNSSLLCLFPLASEYKKKRNDFVEIVFLTIAVHSLSTIESQLLHHLDKTLLSIDNEIVKKDAILIACFTLAKDASVSVQQDQLGHIQVGKRLVTKLHVHAS